MNGIGDLDILKWPAALGERPPPLLGAGEEASFRGLPRSESLLLLAWWLGALDVVRKELAGLALILFKVYGKWGPVVVPQKSSVGQPQGVSHGC